MIKTKRGATEIEGSKAEIYADFATITYAIMMAMKEKGADEEKAIAWLREAFEDGLKGGKMLESICEKKDNLKKIEGLLDQLLDLLGEDEKKEDD